MPKTFGNSLKVISQSTQAKWSNAVECNIVEMYTVWDMISSYLIKLLNRMYRYQRQHF